MELLLARSWFKRVWILQEVANSKTAVVCCGSKSVPANFFSLTSLLLGTEPEPHSQAVLEIMPGPFRKESWWSQKRDLYTLLVNFGKSDASDERDMIYTLLDLSSDAQETNILRPYYTKTTEQFIQDTIFILIGISEPIFRRMTTFVSCLGSLNNMSLYDAAKSDNANDPSRFS